MKNFSIQMECIFAFLMLTIGILLVFLIPPMASPDENTHFYNAYAFSRFDFFPEFEIQNQNGQYKTSELGRRQPKALVDYVEYYNSEFAGKLNQKYNFEKMYLEGFGRVDRKELVFHSYWNANVNLCGYFFSGMGMLIWRMISKIFSLAAETPYNLLIAGRISNLLFYVSTIYYAIKITPFLKRTMFLIAVMPMSVFLAASVSYDAILIPISLLLFAYTSNLIVKNQRIRWYDVVVICGIAVFLFSVKQVYIGLLLILCAVPRSSFQNKKSYIKIIGIVLLAGLMAFLGYQMILHFLTRDFIGTWSNIQNQQTRIILQNPIAFIKIILNSFRSYGSFYLISFLGNLGQLDTNFPILILLSYFFIFLFTAFFEVSSITEERIRKKVKLFSAVGVFFAIYASFAGTYIIWTGMMQGAGVDFVDGIQGRYFIPISIYMVLLFANHKMIKYRYFSYIDNFLQLFVIWLGGMTDIITLLIVLLRFWI